ncbi:MAG TPA: hypothetical protein VGJ48_24925 [Pyrinomonadaceae bacterium]|jgi:hypothetical protein
MPKDPKRNIQSYQLQGGNLNEFEFQKSQSEMAEESELPFPVETDNPNVSQAKRVAEVTAEAHKKVEKRKKRGLVKVGGRKSIASRKRSAMKIARKSTKKETTQAGTKKRASAAGKRSAQKVARKSAKKGATPAGKRSGQV